MEVLSLDVINASAPYKVYWHEASHTYRFRSDYDVVLAIGFDDDDIIETAESYVFSIINVNNVPSENFAALIIRKDNPRFIDVVSEFSNTVAMFRVKP